MSATIKLGLVGLALSTLLSTVAVAQPYRHHHHHYYHRHYYHHRHY